MTCILTVDDSASMRQMLLATLEKEGYDTVQASCAQEALQIIEIKKFDLILTDIHMPDMDGFALIHALRKNRNFRFTPILALTTDLREDMKKLGKAVGATGWITKPFDSDKLLKVLKKVIG
jgi:two-component system, chemotaxis family, chemotaxis protein CheY